MKIIAAKLSDKQETIIRKIARDQIRTLVRVSADHSLLKGHPPETRRGVLSQLLRDFSKLTQSPSQLFNVHNDTDSLFKHELTNLTYGTNYPNMVDYHQYNEAVSSLWYKLTVAGNFNHFQLS